MATTRVPFTSAAHRPTVADGRYRVVIVTSGSVASVKLPLIVAELVDTGYIDVQVVATSASRHFYTQQQVDEGIADKRAAQPIRNGITEAKVTVWTDEDEWSDWRTIGDPILHIELRRWADLVIIAPCSADMLAKIAAGFSDNLALSMLRALDIATPVILFPAMNTHMYQHPFTAQHIAKITAELGYKVHGPQGAGLLACGDEGPGKMTDWREIVEMVKQMADNHLDRGKKEG